MIRSLLAGPTAQIRYSFGHYPMQFSLSNRFLLSQEAVWRAISVAGRVTNNGPDPVRNLWAEVTQMIENATAWAVIEAIAGALLDSGELVGCELVDITRHIAGPAK